MPIEPENKLFVEVADTPHKQAQGLMFVKDLPRDKGMLFAFSRSQKLSFWGENTYIPLDIAFVDSDGIIRKIDKISPLSRKAVSSDTECKYAIEANDDYFPSNRVNVGDKVFLNKDNGSVFVTFARRKGRNLSGMRGSSTFRGIMSQFDNLTPPQQPVGKPKGLMAEPSEMQTDETKTLPLLDITNLSKYLEDDLEKTPETEQMEQPGEEKPEEQPGQVQQPTEPQEFEYPQFNNVFDAADWAELNNEVMRIDYTTLHGTKLVRDVEPHGSFHAKTTSRQILITFDETIGDIRAFIMTNIQTFAFVGKKFDPKFRIH